MHICACSLKKYAWCTVFMSVFLFLVFCGVHKSLFNVFPRSEMVRGNVVTHLMCGLCAWLSLDWPHLTPPAGSITDPHLSHFLSTTYTPPSPHASDCPPPCYFDDFRFTRWLEKPRAAEKCANVRQRGAEEQKKARTAQEAPAALLCVLPRALICNAVHVLTWNLARTQPRQRWERSGRENRRKTARERQGRRRHGAAGDGVGAAGQEEERTEEKTQWLALSSEVNTWAGWLENSIQPLTTVLLTHRFQHCVLNQCLSLFLFPLYHSISLFVLSFLVSLRINPSATPSLNVLASQTSTRLRPNP